jgi:hypothetical protein
MLGGERLTFDQEAQALYDADPPDHGPAHFDSLLARLDSLLPGRAPLAQRYQRFRDRLMIPAKLVDTVFRTAIAACRARTVARLALPPGERFDLEYVKGTPWNAYNWYQGGYRSLIQVNLDFPIPLDRAVDLACHEGYPGHHVYNARNEVARRYLDGELDAAGARRMMQRYWLVAPDAAAKTLRFIDTYRSYVINYNLGRDLVADWIERTAGADEEARWRTFRALLSAPHLPRDLY